MVGCGSLPHGIPGDIYATLVRRIHERGGRVAIDASGAPMAAAVPAGPDLIKPNRVELGELMGRDLGTLGEVVDAARELQICLSGLPLWLGRGELDAARRAQLTGQGCCRA